MAASQTKSQQIKTLLAGLSLKKRLMIGGSALAIGAAILFQAWRSEGDFRPLYTALSPEDAGAIVQKLKEKNVPYRISENGASLLVPSAKVGEARLEMAAAGLPKTGRIGFELFDKTRFGETEFTEHVNMRRALEGELERSVTSMAEVEAARVHITFPKDSVFAENRLPAKASVMLKLRSPLVEQNVAAIRYLVASAVEGLSPDSVSVLDMRGNLLGRPKEKSIIDGAEPSDALIEYKQQIEKNLLAKANATLEPLLGSERFRAAVVADCDFSSGEQSEEILDPERSVMTSEQRTKESSSVASAAGLPGTASNLPRATPRPGSNTGISKETMSASYQTTRTIKRTRTPQGAIKRLSASVLVDQAVRWEGTGRNARRVLIPPSPETLSRISQVVSAALGIQPERGDKLVVETLPFEATLNLEPPPDQAPPAVPEWKRMLSPKLLIVVVLLVAVALWSAARVAFRKKAPPAVAAQAQPAIAPPPAPSEPQQAVAAPAKPAAKSEKQIENQRMTREQEQQLQLEAAGQALQKLTEEVKELAAQDSELCAGVLRAWLAEPEPGSTK